MMKNDIKLFHNYNFHDHKNKIDNYYSCETLENAENIYTYR